MTQNQQAIRYLLAAIQTMRQVQKELDEWDKEIKRLKHKPAQWSRPEARVRWELDEELDE